MHFFMCKMQESGGKTVQCPLKALLQKAKFPCNLSRNISLRPTRFLCVCNANWNKHVTQRFCWTNQVLLRSRDFDSPFRCDFEYSWDYTGSKFLYIAKEVLNKQHFGQVSGNSSLCYINLQCKPASRMSLSLFSHEQNAQSRRHYRFSTVNVVWYYCNNMVY